MKKVKILGMIMIMLLGVTACGSKEEVVPVEPVETPVVEETAEVKEEPVEESEAEENKVIKTETPSEMNDEIQVNDNDSIEPLDESESLYDGKFWSHMQSMTEIELEESNDIYFVNTNFDETVGLFEITASKFYFIDEGLFVELYIYNGLDDAKTNLILEGFSLSEIVDYDEKTNKGTRVELLEKSHIGAFKDFAILPGEGKYITFIVPDEELLNIAYNFDRVSYGWSFQSDIGDTFTLTSSEN